jgi:hypothetical protein
VGGARGVPRGVLSGLIGADDGYLQHGMSPGRHLGLRSPFMTVIVSLYEPLDVARHIDPRRPPARYDCGYHDQSHLVRDFRSFSGLAPSQWLGQEFRNVQAARPVDRLGSTA